MKILNTLLIAGALCVSAGFVSCSDDDDYTPGNATNSQGLNVSFENTGSVVLSPDENSFKITLTRNNTNGDLTVPVKVVTLTDVFTVPSEATFKSGESTTEITVSLNKQIDMFTNYKLTLSVPEEYSTPYDSTSVADGQTPRAELNVSQEDYEPYATGTAVSYMLGEDDDTPQKLTGKTLEYSKIKDNYRIKSFWGDKTGDIIFTWDGKDKVEAAEESTPAGFDAGDYGAVTANFDKMSYDASTKTFTFTITYSVSAGAFDPMNESFIITSGK